MKQGRGRIYPAFDGIEAEIGFLFELHARATDLVGGLPDEVMNAELYGHSVGQLLDHMIDAEIDWISRVAGIRRPSPVSTCDEAAHFTRRALRRFTLESEIAVGPFTCVSQVLRHLQWHWTYHSAQIGLLRKALGHEYKWVFK